MNNTARKKSMLCLLLAMLMVLPAGIAMASPESIPDAQVIQNPPAPGPATPQPPAERIAKFDVYIYEVGKTARGLNFSSQTTGVTVERSSRFLKKNVNNNNWEPYEGVLEANGQYRLEIIFTADQRFDTNNLTVANFICKDKQAVEYVEAEKKVIFDLPAPIQKWTLKFNTNGGEPLGDLEYKSGTVVDLANEIPTKAGHTFEGWFTEPEFTHKVTSISLTADTTVYAKWKRIPAPHRPAPGGSYVPDLGRTPERMEIPAENGKENGYVQAPAGSVDPSTRLRITEKANGKKDMILVDESGNQVYSDELMLVTVPAPKGQQGSYRVKVNGVYTTFELSEDGKYVTMPVVFSRDGKMREDVIVRQNGIHVSGTYKALPGTYALSVTDRGNARYSVDLTDVSGNKAHSNGPVMISMPAPQGVGEVYRLKVDGKWTTFEVKDGIVRFALVF